MGITYFKRFRMEIDLGGTLPILVLPEGYRLIAWDPGLIADHAEVKYRSFFEEIDATVFPSLASRQGCHHLMSEIACKRGFVPEATWLAACAGEFCGTVQGLHDRTGLGAIQNLGVTPPHRGKGVGRALILQALLGFRRRGLGRAFLEVTARNEQAVQLYRQLGFRCRKTIYKAVETGGFFQPALSSIGEPLLQMSQGPKPQS